MIDKINLYLCLGAVLILFVAMLGNAIEIAFYGALLCLLMFLAFRLYVKVRRSKRD